MERLRSHRDFVTVLKRRNKVSDSDIVVHYLVRDDSHSCPKSSQHASNRAPSTAETTPSATSSTSIGQGTSAQGTRRLGLAVSKSVGHAVTRNTVKRRFRVLARQYESLLPEHCDIVMRAKPSAAHTEFSSLDRQVVRLFTTVGKRVAQGR